MLPSKIGIYTDNDKVPGMSTLDMFVFDQATGGTRGTVDNRRNVFALRNARQVGCYDEVLELILHKRRQYLIWLTDRQRDWQTKVSRRPQRGRHHDSWNIREKYVRCTG